MFDQPRDCLWITSRVPPDTAGSQEMVTLIRINLADRTVVHTSFRLDAARFVGIWVLLDARDKVWTGWGRAVHVYDPDTDTVLSYPLPGFASLQLPPPAYDDFDGNFVGLVMDPSGEIWAAASNVAAVFGFNPTLERWDRTIRLVWFNPYSFTQLAAPKPGLLIVSGYQSPVPNASVPVFARVNTANGNVGTVTAHPVREYALIGQDQAVFIDGTQALGTVNLTTGQVTMLAANAPINANGARFAPDGNGHVWFSMVSYRNIGIGSVDLSTGAITTYTFPYVDRPGVVLPDDCPSGAFHCIPSSAVGDVGVQAIDIDANQNVWVVTEQPGANDPHLRAPIMAPVIELKVGKS